MQTNPKQSHFHQRPNSVEDTNGTPMSDLSANAKLDRVTVYAARLKIVGQGPSLPHAKRSGHWRAIPGTKRGRMPAPCSRLLSERNTDSVDPRN